MPSGATSAGLADRYATALFDLAEDQGAIDEVLSDLDALEGAIVENDELRRLLHSPLAQRGEQERAVVALVERSGGNKLTANFLGVLAQHRRLFAFKAIVEAFRRKVAAARGQVEAEIVAAAPLSDEQVETLREAIARYVGAEILLQTRVDPDLLGGLTVRVGSRMVDASLRTKIARLETTLKGAH